jgi:hypothetical protein
MIDITLEELQEKIDDIIDAYDKGDDTVYKIIAPQGEFVLTPYDGPWTETVQLDEEGHHVVPLPERIINKFGLKEGDDIPVVIDGDSIVLKLDEVQK